MAPGDSGFPTPEIQNRAVSAAFLTWLTASEHMARASTVAEQRVIEAEEKVARLRLSDTGLDTLAAATERLEETRHHLELSGRVAASVCNDVVKPLTLQHNQCRFCDLPWIRADPRYEDWFGRADYFVSYAWMDSWADMVDMLCDHSANRVAAGETAPFYWIDHFAVCQHNIPAKREDMPSSDNIENPNQGFRQVIATANRSLVLLANFERPMALTRCWCIFEMWATIDSGASFDILLTRSSHKRLTSTLSAGDFNSAAAAMRQVNLAKASSSREEDRLRILALVEANVGVHRLNVQVKAQLREWITAQAMESVEAVGLQLADRNLVRNVAQMLRDDMGEPHRARRLFQSVVDRAVLPLTPRDKEWAVTIDDERQLGVTMHRQGKLEAAEKQVQQCLVLANRHLDRNSPVFLFTLDDVASVLQSRGKYTEAEAMFRLCLDLKATHLGREHPSTLDAINNLGLVLHDLRRDKAAEESFRHCLAQKKEHLGAEHPSTLSTMNNLALVLQEQEQYVQAEELYRECQALMEAHLGLQHPETLNTMNNVAHVLKRQQRYEAAETIYRRCLSLKERHLGEAHSTTLMTLNNLAKVLLDQRKYEESETMFGKCYVLVQQHLGRDHPHTLATMDNLAQVIQEQGRHAAAETMFRECLAMREAKLTRQHPSTLTTVFHLADALKVQGKYEEAESLLRECLAEEVKQQGAQHSSTLATVRALALVLQRRDQAEESAELLRLYSVSSCKD